MQGPGEPLLAVNQLRRCSALGAKRLTRRGGGCCTSRQNSGPDDLQRDVFALQLAVNRRPIRLSAKSTASLAPPPAIKRPLASLHRSHASGCRRGRTCDAAPCPSDAFAGVEYSVFGCGNRDWSATYQAIPTLIDTELEKHGAKRIYKRGEGDARSDFDRDYRAWYGELFPSLAKALDPAATAEAKMAGPRISVSFVNRLAASAIMRSYSAVAMTVA